MKHAGSAVIDVLTERFRQIDIGGYTTDHDDTVHHIQDFAGFIAGRTNRILDGEDAVYRQMFVEIGALALAAIEKLDRADAKEDYTK